MSKIAEILHYELDGGLRDTDVEDAVESIKSLVLQAIGDVEHCETSDMSLKSWTPEDYKTFGKNELKIELRQKIEDL